MKWSIDKLHWSQSEVVGVDQQKHFGENCIYKVGVAWAAASVPPSQDAFRHIIECGSPEFGSTESRMHNHCSYVYKMDKLDLKFNNTLWVAFACTVIKHDPYCGLYVLIKIEVYLFHQVHDTDWKTQQKHFMEKTP